jgi:DNA repair protein RecO (recombination protein O)
MTLHQSEAVVLRVWPFHEADLLVSLFTRDCGRIKGVARHALRSRRRFGGALEPLTHVRATWAERKQQELARLEAFEILSSPLSRTVDYARTAGLQLVAEVLEEALPDHAPDDAIFRLSLAVLDELHVGRIWLPITYFALWINRLMGWMPTLAHCMVCGLDLRGATVWYSPAADGVTCAEDRRSDSTALSPAAILEAERIARGTVASLAEQPWPRDRVPDLRRFALATLERHLEHRLATARVLLRV